MKKNILFILLILITVLKHAGFAQQCPKRFVEAKYKEKFYAGDELSQQYPLIGLYKESLMEEDKIHSGNFNKLVYSDSTGVQNAYPAIYSALRNNDIVILNECHNMPLHRALLYTILDSFKLYGFQSIFLEALSFAPNDSMFFNNYPNENFGGNYMTENIYNQVLRKIKKQNLNLYSYEFTMNNPFDTISKGNKKYLIDKENSNINPIETDSITIATLFSDDEYTQRNAIQALHIYEKLSLNKIKKAFIYCGYSHEWKENESMAGILQRLLHKNIYCIDQMLLNEHSDAKHESPLYQKYASTPYPVVLLDKNNTTIHSIYFPESKKTSNFLIDMVIASPRTVYINNRPTWLELGGDRKRYPLSKFMDVKTFKNDFLVLFYDNDEYEKGGYQLIPMDAFQVQNGACNYDAILTPNKKYHLVAFQDGKMIVDKIINTL